MKADVVNIRLREFGAVDSEALHDRHNPIILRCFIRRRRSVSLSACGVKLRARGRMKGAGEAPTSDIIHEVPTDTDLGDCSEAALGFQARFSLMVS